MNTNIMTVKIDNDGTKMFYSYTIQYDKVNELVTKCKELLLTLSEKIKDNNYGKYDVVFEPDISKTNNTLILSYFKKCMK